MGKIQEVGDEQPKSEHLKPKSLLLEYCEWGIYFPATSEATTIHLPCYSNIVKSRLEKRCKFAWVLDSATHDISCPYCQKYIPEDVRRHLYITYKLMYKSWITVSPLPKRYK